MPDSSPYLARPARRVGVAVAIAVSLLLHALLLLAYRQRPTAPAAQAGSKVESVTVWIRAAPPPQPPAPARQPALAAADRPTARPASRPTARRPRAPTALTAITSITPTTPITAAPSDQSNAPAPAPGNLPAAPDQLATTAPAQPRFDMDAARRAARQMANTPDPVRAAMPVSQLPQAPLRDETQLAREMARAKRPDCKDGLPGGLLAPLFMLMDKKDSGCKL